VAAVIATKTNGEIKILYELEISSGGERTEITTPVTKIDPPWRWESRSSSIPEESAETHETATGWAVHIFLQRGDGFGLFGLQHVEPPLRFPQLTAAAGEIDSGIGIGIYLADHRWRSGYHTPPPSCHSELSAEKLEVDGTPGNLRKIKIHLKTSVAQGLLTTYHIPGKKSRA